jgi:hypothetical protein
MVRRLRAALGQVFLDQPLNLSITAVESTSHRFCGSAKIDRMASAA